MSFSSAITNVINQIGYDIRDARLDISGAQSTADTAQSTANSANTKADAAQTSADQAKTTADTAIADAGAAQTSADQAKTTADAALADAGAAQTAADYNFLDVERLATDAGNLIRNGSLIDGDKTHWEKYNPFPSNWTVVARDVNSSSASLNDMPAHWAVKMEPTASIYYHSFLKSSSTDPSYVTVNGNEQFRISFDYAGAGATTPSGGIEVLVVFDGSDGEPTDSKGYIVDVDNWGWNRFDAVITTGANSKGLRTVRIAQQAGQSGQIYFTNLKFERISTTVAENRADIFTLQQDLAELEGRTGTVVTLRSVYSLAGDWKLGYSAANDTYVKVGDVVQYAEEGISFEVLASNDGDYDRITAGGCRLKYLPSRREFNVLAFGAIGDGISDDTWAFQKAIDRAGEQATYLTLSKENLNNHNGATVFVPAGRYTCNTLYMRTSGVAVRGSSVTNTMIQQPNGGTLFVIKALDEENGDNIMNMGLFDLDLRGTLKDAGGTSIAIQIGIVKHSYFNKLKFSGFYGDILMKGTQEPCFISDCNFFSGAAVSGNDGDGGGYSIRMDSAILSATSIARTYDQVDPDVANRGYAHTVMAFVNNCEFRNGKDAKEYSIDLFSTDGLYCSNCHFLNANQAFVRVNQRSNISPIANVTFTGCFFDGENPATEHCVHIVAPTYATWANPAIVELEFNGCKFNGTGSSGETQATHILCQSPAVQRLAINGGQFNKCHGDYWINVQRGHNAKGKLEIRNATFTSETGMVPDAFILIGAIEQDHAFRNTMISGNMFITDEGRPTASAYNIAFVNKNGLASVIGNHAQKGWSTAGNGIVKDNTITSGQIKQSGNVLF